MTREQVIYHGDLCEMQKLVKENPNDMDLGKKTRQLIAKMNEQLGVLRVELPSNTLENKKTNLLD